MPWLHVPAIASASDYVQTFRGEVIDALTETPLPGATVIISDSDPLKGTATDPDGRFRLENVPVGRIDVQVSMVGYETQRISNLLVASGRNCFVRHVAGAGHRLHLLPGTLFAFHYNSVKNN